MEICPSDKCTGCYSCVNACISKCIVMKENKFGELHPHINESECKHCNICINSCPNNVMLEFKYPQKCFASWITEEKKRRICASGGIGTILSEFVIQHKQGIVFGTSYNDALLPITSYAENITSIESFKGSKYVQSIVGDETFKKVHHFLNYNHFVLYIGTPCQIAGLRAYLPKDYENLITVDLICHGVCPTKYFNDEIKFQIESNGFKNVTDIRFRGNDSNNFCLSLWDKQKLLLKQHNYCSYYLGSFLWGVSMRENCYTCNYARPERISDITIGDFIGLGTSRTFIYPTRNVSSVTLNNNKAVDFYEEVRTHMNDLVCIERDYEERLVYGPSLRYPFPRHKLNPVFRENYLKMGYVKGIRATLKPLVRKQKIKHYINFWTYSYRIPRKIYRMFLNKFRSQVYSNKYIYIS